MNWSKLDDESMNISREEFGKIIDSTNVKMTATKNEIEKLCREAMEYSFGCVCVLKSGDYDGVKRDIATVVEVKRLVREVVVKVIIETAHLAKEEKIMACRLVKEAKADFVKTSTGFFGLGATVEDVRLMRETVGKEMGVKAAGGIRRS